MINNVFGTVTNFRIRYAPAKLEKLTFCGAYFYFGTAILKVDSFSLSYHIVHTRIAKVTASFSFFALSKLVCAKKVFYPIQYSLLIYPKLIPLWSAMDGLTEKILHPLFPKLFFSLSAWGPTRRCNSLGWPNCGVDGQSN